MALHQCMESNERKEYTKQKRKKDAIHCIGFKGGKRKRHRDRYNTTTSKALFVMGEMGEKKRKKKGIFLIVYYSHTYINIILDDVE